MCHPHLLSIYCANCFKELNASVLPFFFISEAFCLSTLSHLLNRKFSWRIVYILNVLIASVKPRRVILNTHAHQAEASLYLFSRQIEVGLFMTHLGEWGPSGKKVSPSCLRLLSVPSWPPSGPGDTTDTQHSSVRRSMCQGHRRPRGSRLAPDVFCIKSQTLLTSRHWT